MRSCPDLLPHFGGLFGTVRITDLRFVNDAVIFATEVLSEALKSLSEEAEQIILRVFRTKTIGDILDATVESIPVNGENVESRRRFPYSVFHVYQSKSVDCDKLGAP